MLAQPCIFFLSTFPKAEKPLYSKKAILEGNCMQMWQLSFEAPHLTFMHTSHESPHVQRRGASHIVILLCTLAWRVSDGSWSVSCTCCHSISVSRLEVAATLPPPQLITRPLLCPPPHQRTSRHRRLRHELLRELASRAPHLPQSVLSSAARVIILKHSSGAFLVAQWL